jgi:hypothetical protein
MVQKGNGTSPHVMTANRARGFIVVKGHAGLGNRLVCLLSALLYARLADRQLLIDWRDGMYADWGVNAFPELFRCRSALTELGFSVDESVSPWMWRGQLHESATTLRGEKWLGCPFTGYLYSVDVRRLDYGEDVLVIWSLISIIHRLRRHLVGPWRSWRRLSEAAVLRRLWDEEILVHPLIEQRASGLEQSWGEGLRIGIHVRQTDRRTRVSRLMARLDVLTGRHRNARIFLATDNPSVEEMVRARYAGVVTTSKWFPSESAPLHALRGSCPDRLEMAREAVTDLRLLLGCDHLLLSSDSSFGRMATLLWRGDRRRVFDARTLAWLPDPLREQLWRTRDWLKWGIPLLRAGMPMHPRH